MTIPRCVIFKALHLLFRQDVLKRSSPGEPFGSLGVQFSISGLDWPLQAENCSRLILTVPRICQYHFIKPTRFRSTTWLLPLIFTGASCAENLWLTALSRINKQPLFLIKNILLIYDIEYSFWVQIILIRPIWPIRGTRTGSTILSQFWPGNKEVLLTAQYSKTGASE